MRTNHLQLEFGLRRRPLSLFGVGMLCVSLAALLLATVQASQAVAENKRQAYKLAELQAKRPIVGKSATPPPRADSGQLTRVRALRQVALSLRTPWSNLLAALESATNQSVALLSVEPTNGSRSIRLTAEARSVSDMLDYLAALQRDKRLDRVILASHVVQLRTPGSPIRFQIQAIWGSET